MDDRKNLICIGIIIVLIILCAVMFKLFDNKKFWMTDDFEERVIEYDRRIEAKKAAAAELQARQELILSETPGIACWGDGITYGTYGNGTNYPGVLEDLLKDEKYPYPVVNLGVYAEDSLTVLGRAGAIPFVVAEDFTIDGSEEDLIEMKISSENGEAVNPCMQEMNPGFNSCIVSGVNCTIYGESDPTDLVKPKAYYLNREDGRTDEIYVKAGTVIETSGSRNYKDYINVIQLGDTGGYKEDDEELREQYRRFVESLGGSEKYIILGRITGSEEDNRFLDSVLEDEYGSHYINIRKLLTSQEIKGAYYSDADRAKMAEGIVPDCLKTENYLNRHSYDAVGGMVFERLKELEIMEK